MPVPLPAYALHQQLIAQRLPTWLGQAATQDLQTLARLTERAEASRRALEQAAQSLPRYQAYATGALKRLLATLGAADIDPATAVLHWVSPTDDEAPLTCTLVQAALRNFSAADTDAQAFGAGSAVFRRGGADGQLAPEDRLPLAPWAFAAACREADLGAGYARLLSQQLPRDAQLSGRAGASLLPERFIEADRDALAAEACIARMKGLLDATGEALLANWGLAPGQETPAIPATAKRLQLAGHELARALVILAEHDGPHGRPCLLYIPNDPYAPLAQFETPQALAANLNGRLDHPAYVRFLAGYAGLQHEADFVRAVEGPPADDFDQLFYALINPLRALELAVRLVQHKRPFARQVATVAYLPIQNLFAERYSAWADQALANAAVLAVPTARADRLAAIARHERWAAAGEQLGLLVLSFIPGVSEVVAVYSMVQVLRTVYDASRALASGDERHARALLFSAAENAGTLLAGQARPLAAQTQAFAERLQLIGHAQGDSRLWVPDMHLLGSREAPQGAAAPGPDGILRQGRRAWVRLGGRYVPVSPDVTPWHARLQVEPGYRGVVPRLLSNGQGGWRGEYEQPGAWTGATLVRRCDTHAEALEDEGVALALRLADVQEPELQGRAARGEPLPGLLRYMLARRASALELGQAIATLRGQHRLPLVHPAMVRLLSSLPGWSSDVGVELVQQNGEVVALHPEAPRTLRLTTSELSSGQWCASFFRQLSTTELGSLLGHWPSVAQAEQGLASAWADLLETQRSSLMSGLVERAVEPVPAVAVAIGRQFPSLPGPVVNELLRCLDSTQLELLSANRVPLAVAELAAQAQRDLRISLACEALHEGYASADRDRLLVGLVVDLPGWPRNLAIEFQGQSATGPMLYRAGPEGAPPVLIAQVGGYYQIPDVAGTASVASLEEAVTRLVAQRSPAPLDTAWQAANLRSRLTDLAFARRADVRALLGMTADTRPFFRPPTRFAEGRLGYRLSGRGSGTSDNDHIMQLLRQLYPDAHLQTLYAVRMEVGEGAMAIQELARRQREMSELGEQLGRWLGEGNATPGMSLATQTVREVGAGVIMQAWQRRFVSGRARTGDGPNRYVLSLSYLHLGVSLPTLTVSFAHVLELELMSMQLERIDPAFLALFPNARVLSLGENPLRELPRGPAWLARLRELQVRDIGPHCAGQLMDWLAPASNTLQAVDLSRNPTIPGDSLLERIRQLPWLRELELEDNSIELNEQNRGVFTQLRQLETLSLDHNPLGIAPSLQGLARLEWLSMAGTRISELPPGLQQLMAHQHLRLVYVNLAGNRIASLPDLSGTEFFRRAHGNANRAPAVELILDGNPLDPAAEAQLEQARLYFDRYPDSDSEEPANLGPDLWLHDCPQPLRGLIEVARQVPAASSFYQVLSHVVRTAPYIRAQTVAERQEVTARAWALAERFLVPGQQPLPGISELRDRLYEMASEAQGTCGDGVVLTLDQFEGEVQVWQAIAGSSQVNDESPLREALLPARRLYRQALLDAQAQRLIRARLARMQGQEATDPATDLADDLPDDQLNMGDDEVELRLVLRQRLQGQLDLPPVSERLYDALVSDATANRIAGRVHALDNDEGFAGWLVDHQQTWRAAIDRRYAAEFEQAREPYDEAVAYVLARAAQETVAEPLSPAAVALLETLDPEVDWRAVGTDRPAPALSEQQAIVLSNALGERWTQAQDALRLRLTRALLG